MATPRPLWNYDRPRAAVALLLAQVAVAACGSQPANDTSKGTYDPQTGRLTAITYDRNSNGRIDTWTKMDGARAISSELDTNEDGVIDRWEEYDAQGRLARAGWIRQRPPAQGDAPVPPPTIADSWLYPEANGGGYRIEFLDVDNAGTQIVTRREFFVNDQKVRVEEDKDGDGVMDQWETWSGGALTTAEFDEGHDGKPDRRFTYQKGALVLIESDPDAAGAYTRRVVPGGGR